jgi:hypothetical protein
MTPTILQWLQAFNDPNTIIIIGLAYVASYYIVSALFHRAKSQVPGYNGAFRKNGPVDIITSFLWCIGAIGLIVSLIDLVTRNEIGLRNLLIYYALFLFAFAFLYNLLEWHSPGNLSGLKPGWSGELQCFILSIQVMASGNFTSVQPRGSLSDLLAALQLLLGIFFVAVFIAKAVPLFKLAQ